MPLYEYRCAGCGERFEVLQRLGAGSESLTCPRCGAAEPERQLSTFAAAAGLSAAAARSSAQAPSCGGVRSGFT